MGNITDKLLGELGAKDVEVKDIPAVAPPSKGETGPAADVLYGFGSGIPRGVASLFGIPGSLEVAGKQAEFEAAKQLYALPESEKQKYRGLQYGGKPIDMGQFFDVPPVKRPRSGLPTVEESISGAASILPEQLQPALTYRPKTAAGRIAQTAGEFTGGALFPGGVSSSALRQVPWWTGLGAVTGAAEEVSPTAGTVTGLGGTALLALLQARRGRAANILRDIEKAGPKARALQAAGQEVGIPLTAAETIGGGRLEALTKQTMAEPTASKIIEETIKPRTEAIIAAKEGLLGDIGPSVTLPRSLAREAQEAAAAEMSALKSRVTDATSPLYEVAGKQIVKDSAIEELIALARAEKKRVSPGGPTSKAIDKFISRISTPTKAKKPSGLKSVKTEISVSQPSRKPVVEVDRLESATREFKQLLKLDPSKTEKGMLPEARGIVGGRLNRRLDEILVGTKEGGGVKQLKEARQTHKDMTAGIVDVAGDSGLKAMAKANISAKKAAEIMSPASAENTPQSITKLADSLNNQDATVFPKLARYWMQTRRFGKADDALSGSLFVEAVRGQGDMAANFDAMIAGVARAKGQSPELVVQATNKVMDVLEATGRVPALTKPASAVEAVKQPAGLLGGLDITQPLASVSNTIRTMGAKKFYKKFAEAMVAPDSLKALEDLARTNATRDQYAAFLNTIIQPTREVSGGLLAGPQE